MQYVELNLWSTDQCKKAFDDFNDDYNNDIQFNVDGLEICAYDTVLKFLKFIDQWNISIITTIDCQKIIPKWSIRKIGIQLRAKQTAPLVNKHYENEVTLRQQNWS